MGTIIGDYIGNIGTTIGIHSPIPYYLEAHILPLF